MNKAEVIGAIERERGRLIGLMEGLGEEAERVPVTEEGWTAKDVLAHCIHWLGQIAFGVGAPLHPPAWVEAAGSERPDGTEWNRRVVEHYRPMPLQAVRRDFDTVLTALVDRLRSRDDIDYDARANVVFPWIQTDVPVWKAIAGETFEHWPEHSAQLEHAPSRSA